MFRNASASFTRLDQSVRNSTQAPSGIRPCLASQFNRNSEVKMKSSFWATSAEASTTTAGRRKLSTGIVSTVLSGWSLPEIQCAGASKWVPVCSPQVKLFQYQPGPFSSYWLMRSIEKPAVWPNWGGSCKAGKLGDRVWVRSTRRTCLLSIAWIKAANGFLSLISSPTWVLCRHYRCLPCMAQDRDQPLKQPAPSGPAPPSLYKGSLHLGPLRQGHGGFFEQVA